MSYIKNTSGQGIGFAAVNASTGSAMAGTTGFAAYRVLDGGAQAAATGTVTDKGNGQYWFALSQADTNGDSCSFLFTMTGMIPCEKTITTTISAIVTSGTGTDQISLNAGKILLQPTQTGVTIPTVTNLTIAPTSGDFTATMKTSLNQSTPATTMDMTQAVPNTNTAGTVGDALNATRAQGFGSWSIVGTVLTLNNHDGSSAHIFDITLDSNNKVTGRTER